MTKKKINVQSAKEEVKVNTKSFDISGDRQKDLKVFLSTGNIDFGILLLEYYVPRNKPLISYCKFKRDIKYITMNLKAILDGRN